MSCFFGCLRSVRASRKPAAQPVLGGLARAVCLGSAHLTGTGTSPGLSSCILFGLPCAEATLCGFLQPGCSIKLLRTLWSAPPSAPRQRSAACPGVCWLRVSWAPAPLAGPCVFSRACARRSATLWLCNPSRFWTSCLQFSRVLRTVRLSPNPGTVNALSPDFATCSANTGACTPSVFSLVVAQSLKATMLSWARQLSIESETRRIQGHHRLSGADRSVALYSRDDVVPIWSVCRPEWSLPSAMASVPCNRWAVELRLLLRTLR